MRQAQTLDQAKAEVEAVIKAAHVKAGGHLDDEVTIYLWWEGCLPDAPPCVGVRIAELSFSRDLPNGTCGSSYMACEPAALGVIAAAERAIIERMVCTCSDEEWDHEVEDADWRLVELLKG